LPEKEISMQLFATRSCVTACVGLAGAGVIAVTPLTASPPRIQSLDVQLVSGEDMVLDLVRHGESVDNVAGIIGTTPPGAALTDLGQEQAITVGQALYNGGTNDIDGVFASEFTRTQQTAWPLIELLQGKSDYADIPAGPAPILDPTQILPGLNELNAGVLEGTSQSNELTSLLYLVAPLAWMSGQYWVPQLGSTVDPNGMAFEDRFSDAVQTIYDAGGALDDGELHDVAFSHAAAISTWVMMNVKNPDFEVLLDEFKSGGLLSNTGQVVVEGNPTDGWTLISYDGTAVPADPGLGTELFVDYRDLITAPQMAGWHIWEAVLGGDPTEISTAVQTGFDDVGAALLQFPQAVFTDILDAFQSAGSAAAGQIVADGLASAILPAHRAGRPWLMASTRCARLRRACDRRYRLGDHDQYRSGAAAARHRRAGRGRPPRQQAGPGALSRLGSGELRREVVDLL
jgi:broad specificity phosphatase PhoE